MVTPIEFLGIEAEITGSAYLPSKVVITTLLFSFRYARVDMLMMIMVSQGKGGGAGGKSSGEAGAKPSVFQVRNNFPLTIII